MCKISTQANLNTCDMHFFFFYLNQFVSGIYLFFRSPVRDFFSVKNLKKILAINNFVCQ